MSDTIIPLANITHSASAKTLTLLAPFVNVTVERIKSIRNLTVGSLIYDSTFPKDKTISMTGAVITYTDSTAMQDADIMQIFIEYDNQDLSGLQIASVDGGTP